ncbi:MAG: YHS domain-containing (seleno)protein [Maricaulaceae bacterium]|jgi:YHS domain-containing protein
MKMRLIPIAFLAAFAAAPALAGEQFVDRDGRADFGYDVVAYHTDLAAVPGVEEFAATYNGATFLFASAENRDLFAADPARFAPAYDGHCAYALTRNKKLTVDPEAFSIVDPSTLTLVDPATYDPRTDAGVLYLNYSPSVNADFNADIPGNIAAADLAWDDCLELRPAARPNKGLRDLFPGRRPRDCPAV